jgi:IS30 family transposase
MSRPHRISVTKEQWDEAAAAYELGSKHGAQIAREFGVSPATVTREFQRRGCRKACRVDEYVAEFIAKLDAEAEAKARAKAAADAARKAVVSRLVGELWDAFDAADQAGEPREANPSIARIGWELHLACNPPLS